MGLQSKIAGILIASGVLLLTGGALGSQASANDFQGECPTAAPVVCTLDEPEGSNAATHGTITVTRAGPVFTFSPSFNPGAGLASGSDPIQLCMVEDSGQDNPYVPTNANTCAGSHGDPTKFQAFPVVFDAGSLLATPDAPVWFALHVNIQDGGARTTYIVGSGGGGSSGTTTTTGCDGAARRVGAGAISTSACTTTTTTVATTTTTAAVTTTTLPPTTTTLPPTTTTVPQTTTTQQATTTTEPEATTTTAAAGPTTTTGSVSGTTITSPRATPTTVGAQVLGVVFEAPAGGPTVVGTLPRTGTTPRVLLLIGATLLCLGVWLFLLSVRRSPRGAHR